MCVIRRAQARGAHAWARLWPCLLHQDISLNAIVLKHGSGRQGHTGTSTGRYSCSASVSLPSSCTESRYAVPCTACKPDSAAVPSARGTTVAKPPLCWNVNLQPRKDRVVRLPKQQWHAACCDCRCDRCAACVLLRLTGAACKHTCSHGPLSLVVPGIHERLTVVGIVHRWSKCS